VDPEFTDKPVGRPSLATCAPYLALKKTSAHRMRPTPLNVFQDFGDRKFSSESLVGYEKGRGGGGGIRSMVGPKFHVGHCRLLQQPYATYLSVEPGAPFSESHRPAAHCYPVFLRKGC